MQALKAYFLTSLLLLFAFSVHASQQKEIDKLLLQIDTASNKSKAELYNQLSKAYWHISNEKSLDAAKQALEYAREQKDSLAIANSYNRMGNAYANLGIYEKGVEYYLAALKIQEKIKNQEKIADLYNNIGLIYSKLKEYSKAKEYLEKSMELGKPFNKIDFTASLSQNLGSISLQLGEFEQAMKLQQKALSLYQELNDSVGIAKAYNNLGNCYKALKENDKALDSYFKSLEIKRAIRDLYNSGSSLANIAVLYLLSDRRAEAHHYIKELKEVAKKTNSLSMKNKSYLLLAAYYELEKKIPAAFNYYKLYTNTQDSLNQQQKAAAIADIQARYKIEAQDRQIELLQKDNQIQLLESKKHRMQRNAILILALLTSALTIGVLWAYGMKRKHNCRLEEKNAKLKASELAQKELNDTKDKLFSIIAHDLINPFNAILGFSEYLERNYDRIDDDDKINSTRNIHQASKQAYNLLNNLLQWARSQTNKLSYRPFKLHLLTIVNQNVLHLQANAREKAITIEELISEEHYVWADEHLLSTVLRNLLSNAIKFTHPMGQISIHSRVVNDRMEISIRDNGIGISKEKLEKLFKMEHNNTQPGTLKEPGTGLGLVLCKEFVEKNKGKIWVESEPGKGSSFIFTVPINKQ